MRKKRGVIALIIVSVFIAAIVTASLIMFLPRRLENRIPEDNIESIQCSKYVGIFEDEELIDLVMTDFLLQEEKYSEFFTLINDLTYVKENAINATRYKDPNSITVNYTDGAKIVFSESDYAFYNTSGTLTKSLGFNNLDGFLQAVYLLFDLEMD